MKLKTMNKLLILTYIFSGMPNTASADLFKCNACPAGYKCDGISKTICSVGTYSSAGASSCTKCPEGQFSNEGSSSCGPVCLKNAYTILIPSYSGNNPTGWGAQALCYTSFSSRTFSAGTKADDKVYSGTFTNSRGQYKKTNEQWVPCSGQMSGASCHSCDCEYTGGTIYSGIKFHYNSSKGKIEVISQNRGSCINKSGFTCVEYAWSNGSVIAELEATMCK
ncbi:hypothetical protein HDR59_03140 [bacterium]|nr:hypothetical protein [bacterium]